MDRKLYEDWMAGELTNKEGLALMKEHMANNQYMASNQLMNSKKYRDWLDARESSKSDENTVDDTTMAAAPECDSVSEKPKKVVKQAHFETCSAIFGTVDDKVPVMADDKCARMNKRENIREMLQDVKSVISEDGGYYMIYGYRIDLLIRDMLAEENSFQGVVQEDVLAAFAVGFNAEDPGAVDYDKLDEDYEHAERCRLQLNAEFPEAAQLKPPSVVDYKMSSKEKLPDQPDWDTLDWDTLASQDAQDAQDIKNKTARHMLDNVQTAANPLGIVDLTVQQVESVKLNDDKTLPTNDKLFNALNK